MAAGLAALALLAGCGGQDAAPVLEQTTANLAELERATLDLRVLTTPADGEEGVGFTLAGPVDLGGDGTLPVADLTYTRITGEERTTADLLLTGEEAYVRAGGQAFVLGPEQTDVLRRRGAPRDLGALGLDPASWLEGATVEDGPAIDGAPTDRVNGDLDLATMVVDLLRAAGRAGAPVSALPEGAASRLDEALEEARLTVLTGRDDRLLRGLELRAQLRQADELRELLPGGGGLTLEATLRLSALGEAVEVQPPVDARPLAPAPAG